MSVDPSQADPTSLRFTEEMKGYVTIGETDFARGGGPGEQNGAALMVHLTIDVEGVNRFVVQPEHLAQVSGYVLCDALGGKLTVSAGTFNLFVDQGDPSRKQMLYRLFFEDSAGHPLTLSGFKSVVAGPVNDVWHDTSTMYTRLLEGHVAADAEKQAAIVASGIIRIHLLDFLKQLTTFRVAGPTVTDRASVLTRFGTLFLGTLWDVYARQILSASPF
jgi:hypothetical protein